MRIDGENFRIKNTAPTKEPYYVVRIYFDNANTDYVEFTSHPNSESSGGTVISDVVKGISGVSQKINPDQGNSTIGGFSFTLVDKDGAITEKLKEKLAAGDGIRLKRVQCYVGYKDLLWADYNLILTYIIDSDLSYINGEYKIKCSDIQRIVRNDIFNPEITTLNKSINSTQDFVPVSLSDFTKFPTVLHDSSYSDRPNEEVGYIIIDDEIICFSGLFTHVDAGPSFQVVERGALNTLAVAHEADASKSEGNRKKVTEIIFIAGPAPKVAYQLLTGHVAENICLQSEVFGTTWTPLAAAVVSNVGASPNGASTADRIDVVASNTSHFVTQTVTVTASSTYTFSVWLKNDGDNFAFIGINKSFTDYVGAVVDLSTGKITHTVSDTSTIVNVGAVNHGTWVRLFISVDTGAFTSIFLNVGAAGSAVPAVYIADRPSFLAVAGEDVLAWGAQLSESNYFVPYVQTTTTAQEKKTLPDNWSLGIDHELVRLENYTRLDKDLWNQFDDTGRHVRFLGPGKTDGKRFIETELMYWMASFMPIYSNGQIGVKRLSPVLSNSGHTKRLDASNIVKYTALKDDFNSVINQIFVDWNYNFIKDDFTKTAVLFDADSTITHNPAPIKKLKLRGIHTATHTDEDLLSYFDSMRDRYSGPPKRLSVTVIPSLNTLEVGDVINVELDKIRDINAPIGETLDRAFEIQQVSTDWITGDVKLDLFGSSQKAGSLVRSTLSSVLDDSFYTSSGVELSTVLTIVGNAVTVSGSLTGGDTMAEGVYYYDGNLIIDAGVTVTISENVELRVKGHLTVNGTIDGKGQGHAGSAGSSEVSIDFSNLNIYSGAGVIDNRNPGIIGYLGATSAGGGLFIDARGNSKPINDGPADAAANQSVNYFSVVNNSTSLSGSPVDLRGTSGGGGRAILRMSSGFVVGVTVEANGGAGGAGGAGLTIVSRGGSFGVNGGIDTSGDDGAVGASHNSFAGQYLQPGSGAGGAPGGLVWLIDGNQTPPEIATFHTSNLGDSPILGQPTQLIGPTIPGLYTGLFTGYQSYSYGKSAYSLQYIPESAVIEEEQKDKFIIAEAFLQSWTGRRSAAQVHFSGVTFGNDLLVAVGSNVGGTAGIIQTSSDRGNSWTARTVPGTVSTIRYVTYGNGLFVAVGAKDGVDGYIATSPDGITWTERANPQNLNLNTIAFNDGLFVAAGESSSGVPITYITTSTDGITWVDRSPAVFHGNCNSIIWGDNEWMILSAVVLTSPDGVTWSQVGSTSVSLYNDLIWDGSNYVAVHEASVYGDGVYTSPDGVTWTGQPTPHDTPLTSIEYSQGVYIATGQPFASQTVILTSRDAITWTNINFPSNITNTSMIDVTFADNFFIIVGQNVDATYGGAVLTSVRIDY